jgi:hypothetical protein
MQDAVNDLSVPYHLMTKEYNDSIKKILKPNGVYLLTLIDSVSNGVLWRAAVKTMRETFPYVYLIDSAPFANSKDLLTNGRHVLIVYGSDIPIDLEAVQRVIKKTVPNRMAALASLGAIAASTGQVPSFAYIMSPKVLDDVMETPLVIRRRDPKNEDKYISISVFGGIPILLRDQYAPVDNLMSGVFRDRAKK